MPTPRRTSDEAIRASGGYEPVAPRELAPYALESLHTHRSDEATVPDLPLKVSMAQPLRPSEQPRLVETSAPPRSGTRQREPSAPDSARALAPTVPPPRARVKSAPAVEEGRPGERPRKSSAPPVARAQAAHGSGRLWSLVALTAVAAAAAGIGLGVGTLSSAGSDAPDLLRTSGPASRLVVRPAAPRPLLPSTPLRAEPLPPGGAVPVMKLEELPTLAPETSAPDTPPTRTSPAHQSSRRGH